MPIPSYRIYVYICQDMTIIIIYGDFNVSIVFACALNFAYALKSFDSDLHQG